MIAGIAGFFKTCFLLLVIVEFTFLIEEFFLARLELRKGFSGTKTSLFRVFQRHLFKVLKTQGNFSKNIFSGLRYVVVFVAAGLLPSWFGETPILVPHSLWVFLTLIISGPIFHLVFEWAFKKGAGWPSILTTAERITGSATVLIILAITLVAITGFDSFQDFVKVQQEHGWMIFIHPFSVLLLFAYTVVTLFVSFQSIFSRTGDARPEGWSMDDLLPHLRRATWSLFMVDIFLGGAEPTGILGDLLLIIKCVALSSASVLGAQAFFQLREDQAESFIVWRLAPLAIVILALSLLFPGGLI